ncbi:MAG: plasmid mobilization relaxosome protein MobC [Oscillospiraceae bacterium]|nr:plasmid mobilization relaxosome protein MobC [Oscillospiraceae bacterium]
MRKRNKEITIWLNDEEYEAIMDKQARSGLKKQPFFRAVLAGAQIKEQPPAQYHEVLKELRQIGNNINQIAARANAAGIIDAATYRENYAWLQRVIGDLVREVYS